MKGTVSISIDDFNRLQKEASQGIEAVSVAKDMDAALSSFVEFMARTNDIELIAERFNKGTSPAKLVYKSGTGWVLQKK